MQGLMTFFDPILPFLFRIHDAGCDFLVRYIRIIKYILLIGAHLVLFGFFFPDLRKDFGEMAANLLIGILFLSPLATIFRMRLLLLGMGLRREFGIMMAYLATVHGVGYLLDPQWFEFVIGPHWPGEVLGIQPMVLFGIGAYFLTLPLLFTSNTWANRILGGKNWKMLHRSVYIVFVFVVLHRALMRGGDTAAFLQAGLLLGAYIFLKVLAYRNFLSPLAEMIVLVSERYRQWKTQAPAIS